MLENADFQDGNVDASISQNIAISVERHFAPVTGKVVGGAKLGRTLGFPTANMTMRLPTALRLGVYAVRFQDAAGTAYDGVASFGRRPTVVTDGELLLETHLIDYEGDLYGQTCTVRFIHYLRPELKFPSLESMVERIRHDILDARRIFEPGPDIAS